jgi:hypothetical protein
VEIRIHERDRALDHADEHVAPAMGNELEAFSMAASLPVASIRRQSHRHA